MKYILLLLLLLLLLTISQIHLWAQNNKEQLRFEIRFGLIKGGEAIYSIKDTIHNNKSNLHSQLRGYTTGFAQMLYAVDDNFESIINKDEALPYKASKRLKEQNYRFNNEVTFNHSKEKAFSTNSGWHDINYGTCDISAIIYKIRNSTAFDGLIKDQIITLPFWDTDETYLLEFKYTGEETIKTKLGEFSCIRLEPLKVAGRFFEKENPINIWITKDEKKLPVLMELNFNIGKVRCELTEYS
jgi:hypothetical protein